MICLAGKQCLAGKCIGFVFCRVIVPSFAIKVEKGYTTLMFDHMAKLVREVKPKDVGFAMPLGHSDDRGFAVEPPCGGVNSSAGNFPDEGQNDTRCGQRRAGREKPVGDREVGIAGNALAAFRMFRILSGAVSVWAAESSTRRSDSAVLCSATVNAWLRRNETLRCIQRLSKASGEAT